MLRRFVFAIAFAGLTSSAFAGTTSSLFSSFFSLDDEPASSSSLTTVNTRPAARAKTPVAAGKLSITIDISTQSMTVADQWDTIYVFDVSTGRPGHATPTGTFRPIRMHKMWYSSKYENAPMPWSIFFHGGYAIHGTTDVKHLGHVASHGCVRLDPKNAKLLYDLVSEVGMENTRVVLIRS